MNHKIQSEKENHKRWTSPYPFKKKMGISWYVQLNILVMGFLFVLFLIKQVQNPTFKMGLNNIFGHSSTPPLTSASHPIRIKAPPQPKTSPSPPP